MTPKRVAVLFAIVLSLFVVVQCQESIEYNEENDSEENQIEEGDNEGESQIEEQDAEEESSDEEDGQA